MNQVGYAGTVLLSTAYLCIGGFPIKLIVGHAIVFGKQ